MDTLSSLILFLKRGDIEVEEISIAQDVGIYLRDRAGWKKDRKYRIERFMGYSASVSRTLPQRAVRVVYRRNGILTQTMFYNVGEKKI